ncbi:MarR family winged helix-turn-helix transcriptional regulator [Hydrogenophaga sp.]|uniref:MarR family winged helix-turn-helix transcriptional regulator n=1 Tax=Hydrogenophaga sp. TaxID=1904254 RepID=UPI00262AB2C8|nr:MarR family winged helix-turn-helix transcriptional regulator [Hydrogenophaga sp.]MCW5655310.1 winged helix-turn-helix transcriptional regulator [Hydrogenophaga sp.]
MATTNRSSDTEVIDRLHGLMHGLRRFMHEAMREDGLGLAPMEARCLAYFVRNPGHTQRDLVQHAGRDKAQIARIVKALHERGLLESTPDPQDGRAQRIAPTAQGRAQQQRMRQHQARFERALTAGLDRAERSSLLDLLDRLQANVGERN